MNDNTTKKQVIEGTLKGMDEIYHPVKEYVRRRLERAYELGYAQGRADHIEGLQ